MSVQVREGKYIVRWRGANRHRSKSFMSRADAEAFEEKMKRRQERARAGQHLRMFDQHIADGKEQVYVVQGADKVKVGRSTSATHRVIAMQTGSPVPLAVVWQIHCADAGKLERALHRRYKAYRLHGEWFEAAPVLADLDALAALGACQFVSKAPQNSGPDVCVSDLGAD